LEEVQKLYDEYDVVKFIRLARLRWAGHVTRMEKSDPARKVFWTKPGGGGNSRKCRPKLRWCDELEEDIAWVWCRDWRINAQSRKGW
jgi:hypothetical protein